MLCSVGLDLFWQISCNEKKGVSWENGFAIGDANTKIVPKNALFSRLTRKASPLLPSRQTLLSNGSSCIQEFVFETRFNVPSKNGH